MKYEDFLKWLDKQIYHTDYLVKLMYKYDFEKEYTITNELLSSDSDFGGYTWNYDWNEGQKDVKVVSVMRIEDIPTIDDINLIKDL